MTGTAPATHPVIDMANEAWHVEALLGDPGQVITLHLANRQVIGQVTAVFTVLDQLRWVEVALVHDPRFVERVRWADVEAVEVLAAT